MDPIWNAIRNDPYLTELCAAAPGTGRIGRIVAQDGPVFEVATADGISRTRPAGRLSYLADLGSVPRPAVGDYVELDDGIPPPIGGVLPRRSVYERKEAGERSMAQVICANVDLALIVTTAPPQAVREETDRPLLHDFSVRRIERFIATLDPRVRALVVINKCDLIDDVDRVRAAVESELPGTPAVMISALSGEGTERLCESIESGRTAVLVGSSGSGKSTLIRRLIGEHGERAGETIRTATVRATDGRGRHTTTGRRMYALSGGGLLVDTPGVREVQLWTTGADDQLGSAFPEIDDTATECRFSDCRHQGEPGCAVRAAVQEGRVSHDRYLSYLQLQAEHDVITARRDKRERLNERRAARKSRMKRSSRGS